MTRSEAMLKVQMLDFALDDTILFLDTHPNNKAALAFYEDTHKKYMEAMDNFRDQFGPLQADDVNTKNGWTWIDSPWPWELED